MSNAAEGTFTTIVCLPIYSYWERCWISKYTPSERDINHGTVTALTSLTPEHQSHPAGLLPSDLGHKMSEAITTVGSATVGSASTTDMQVAFITFPDGV
jgi:hypothetical protein